MKKLILLFTMMTTLNAFADLPVKCQKNNIEKLKDATNLEMPHLRTIIVENIIPNLDTCEVASPRPMIAAVCGMHVSNKDHYFLKTISGKTVRITTSESYTTCYPSERSFLNIINFEFKN